MSTQSPALDFAASQFIYRCQFGQQGPAKEAGFRWDPTTKTWWTKDAEKASALLSVATAAAKAALEAALAGANASIAASKAVDAAVEIPCPTGLAYLPYQKAGIAYALARPATLIGDEMGLGKTIQAIGVINTLPTDAKIIIVCPASLRLNWKREIEKWSVLPRTIGIVENGKDWPEGDVIIINYDLLGKHAERLAVQWDLLVIDEAHYLKNGKALRTKAALGDKGTGGLRAHRRLFLTGTPISNRPIELWSLIHSLDPSGLGASWRTFATRYCNGRQGRYGWEVDGASNLDELQRKLRASVMCRRQKSEVLAELPAKRRQIVVLPTNGASAAVKAENKAFEATEKRLEALRLQVELGKAGDDENAYERAVEALRDATRAAFTEISVLRHRTALAKVPAVLEHLQNSEEKQIVFCHHKDVAEELRAALAEFGVVTLTGDSDMTDRQAAVDRFQTDPACRYFIGTMGAAGVGITLTASSHVIFAELDWVPGTISQAEDRAHRIGQTNSVLIQHLVLDGSLDARMANVLVEKQAVIDAALDDDPGRVQVAEQAEIPELEEPATKSTSRARIATEAAMMTAEQIAAIHGGLIILARRCDGAFALDGAGFNKMDAGIGHDLAGRATLTPKQAALGKILVRKYQRQLSRTILDAALNADESPQSQS